ncbi:MAG TPA: DUF4920 domain-containing protein [Thermoanaerobaculia bacterium]|nr:DUF4920 domain-containing protein [Thermoanaerobaculia bacterium]
MKKLAVVSLLVAATAFAGEKIVKRGAAIPADAELVPLAQVLEKPDQYAKSAVVTEGVIETACERKGCWMQLAPEAGKPGVRVTFKDYGFFVPTDSKGMTAKVEGVVAIETLSKEDADHLAAEGAKLTRNEDGTAREISFVANGVELRK